MMQRKPEQQLMALPVHAAGLMKVHGAVYMLQ